MAQSEVNKKPAAATAVAKQPVKVEVEVKVKAKDQTHAEIAKNAREAYNIAMKNEAEKEK